MIADRRRDVGHRGAPVDHLEGAGLGQRGHAQPMGAAADRPKQRSLAIIEHIAPVEIGGYSSRLWWHGISCRLPPFRGAGPTGAGSERKRHRPSSPAPRWPARTSRPSGRLVRGRANRSASRRRSHRAAAREPPDRKLSDPLRIERWCANNILL